MRRRDISSALIGSAAGAVLLSGTAQAQACTPPCFPQTPAEIAAGVTPVNYEYIPGDVRRYGTTLNTTTLTKWASVGGDLFFPVAQTALITAPIPLVSNSTITFVKGATIETSTPNISLFTATSKSRIKINGARFRQLSAGGAAYVGGVTLSNCSYCEVSECEFEGIQWAGVYLDSSTQCTIVDNHFHDFLSSSAGDKGDIIVYRNSSYNTVRGNRCFGGLNVHHGVFIQDPGATGTFLPQHNKILDNWVGDHDGYGIVIYIGGPANSYNQIIGNTVQNIRGSYLSGHSGTGIYCVGAGIGGTQVLNNIVRNCCSATVDISNAPGGITIADSAYNSVRCVVTGNTVEGMTQASGILIVGAMAGTVVSGNSIHMPSANNGGGVGGSELAGQGIRVHNAPDTDVTGNIVIHSGLRDAFLSWASAASVDRVNVTGNIFRATTGNALRFDREGSFLHTDCVIGSNQLRTDGSAPLVYLEGMDRVSVTSNNGATNLGQALVIIDSTSARVVANSLHTNGTNALTVTGTCTGSYYDKSNRTQGTLLNGGAGFKVEHFATAVPVSGTYVAGDTVWFLSPSPGTAPGAICTSGGSPGVWKSMAAIAP